MITCTVCGQNNDDLSILCSSCKSYLQGRVDALDLFGTLWQVIESPGAAFRKITLSKHKNYTFVLSALSGISFLFDVAWYKNLANTWSFPAILEAAILLGPIVGMVGTYLLSLLFQQLTRLIGGNARRWNIFAGLAYAMVPMVFLLVFIVPIEIAVFGADFFGSNPPPGAIRPLEYALLMGVQALGFVWMIFLLVVALRTTNGLAKTKWAPVLVIVSGVGAAGMYGIHLLKL